MIGIIILHFNEIEETKKCVKSFLDKLVKKSFFIVIVDNGSKNNTGKILKMEYSKYKNIHVILSNKNLGFSSGNNLGCDFARKFNPDFLIVTNNDTYIDDSNLIGKIYKNYEETKFDVLGPKIWNTKLNYNQNPYQVIASLNDVNRYIVEEEKLIRAFKYKYFVFLVVLKKIKYLLKKIIKKDLHKNIEENLESINLGLSGTTLIFSKKYLEKYKDIFLNKTFIYSEEHFLNYRRIKDNLKFSYDFNIVFYHDESVSTKKYLKNKYKKWWFQLENQYKNKFELKKLYEELESE